MSKRKKRRLRQQQKLSTSEQVAPSSMQFTLLEIKMLKDAVAVFEHVLEWQDQTVPNKDFAGEVVRNIKDKLNSLLQQEDWKAQTPLDYNEIWMLTGALHIYLLHLKATKKAPLIPQCIQLCTRFLGMANYADTIRQREFDE